MTRARDALASAAPWAAGAAGVAGLAALVTVTWPGWFGMNHATGAVAAIADAIARHASPARSGEIPATVYLPAYPLLLAGLRGWLGSWHGALRVASAAGACTLLAAGAFAARAAGASARATALGVGLLAAAFPVHAAAVAGRADLFADAFTLAAVGAWCLDREQRHPWAAVAAALAVLVKASALVVPLAMALDALRTRRAAPFARFTLRWLTALAAGVALTAPVHAPAWFALAVRTLATSSPASSFALRGPAELLRYLGSFAELLAIAGLAVGAIASGHLRGEPLRPALGSALVIALVVLAKRASDHNHLIEPVALGAVAIAAVYDGLAPREAAFVATLALLATVASGWRDAQVFARGAWSADAARSRVIEAIRAEPGDVLTEDPLLALAAGRRPAFVDPASVRTIASHGDTSATTLARRLRAGAWPLLVLEADPAAGGERWYRDFHLGDAAASAIRARYARAGEADGFVLMRPRPGGAPAP